MDKYYTKESVAKMCVDMLLPYISKDDIFIEPSVGSGSFVNIFPYNIDIKIDLYPESSNGEIINEDWLNFKTDLSGCVIVGNPPFGKRGYMSDKFILKSLTIAKCIAFILPDVYLKDGRQKIFPNDWSLVEIIRLPRNSFIYEGKDYHVPCSFFIWIKDSYYKWIENIPNLRESVKPVKTTEDFTWDKNGRWFMFGAAPHRIIKSEDKKDTNRGYTFNASENVVESLKNITWKNYALSSANGGVAWYTKKQIVELYVRKYQKLNLDI